MNYAPESYTAGPCFHGTIGCFAPVPPTAHGFAAIPADGAPAACRAMADALQFHGVKLLDLCVGATHWHVLARFTPLPKSPGIQIPGLDFAALKREARRLMGIAKKESARALSEAHLAAPGGVWAVRCGVRPVRNRGHQLALVRYVRAHARQGAAVWSQRRKQSP